MIQIRCENRLTIESIHYAYDPKISLYDINLMLGVSHSMVCSCKQTMLQHLI